MSLFLELCYKNGRDSIPHPLTSVMHSDNPKETIHFYFLYQGETATVDEYALLIQYYASIYYCLESFSDASYSAFNTALSAHRFLF